MRNQHPAFKETSRSERYVFSVIANGLKVLADLFAVRGQPVVRSRAVQDVG